MGRHTRSALLAAGMALAACSSGAGNTPAPPPPCDQACQDAVGLRAVREMMKLAFNLLLQGQPVGPQDASGPCPLGGTAHVFGTATSNAVQGATEVQLTYVLDHCGYSSTDTDPNLNYDVIVNGTIKEQGTLAVQPSSTTALDISSDAIDVSGTVLAPPVDYAASACPLVLGQDGNKLSGTICGRQAGLTL